jgi:hypothetical protein
MNFIHEDTIQLSKSDSEWGNTLYALSLTFYSTSTKGKKRLSKKERETIILSDITAQVLVGIMLGDGHIQQRSVTGNSRFLFTQTSVKHKNYYQKVFNLFEPYCTKDLQSYCKSWEDKKTKQIYESLSFATIALPCFNKYREMFYLNNIKVVPSDIFNLLTEIGLAHWIMDDGSKHGKGLHLNVYAFSTEDVNRLINTLENKFGFKCSIHLKENKPSPGGSHLRVCTSGARIYI